MLSLLQTSTTQKTLCICTWPSVSLLQQTLTETCMPISQLATCDVGVLLVLLVYIVGVINMPVVLSWAYAHYSGYLFMFIYYRCITSDCIMCWCCWLPDIFALQPKGMLMYGLLKSVPYVLYSGYLFRLLVCTQVCRVPDRQGPNRLLQTSVPANVYCLLIRTLAQEAVPSDRAKACESLCGGKPSLLVPTLGNSAPWPVYGIYSVKITAC